MSMYAQDDRFFDPMDRSTWSDDDADLFVESNNVPVVIVDDDADVVQKQRTPSKVVRVNAKDVQFQEADVVSKLSQDLFDSIIRNDPPLDDNTMSTILQSVYGIEFTPQAVQKLHMIVTEGRERDDVTQSRRMFVVDVLADVADQKLDIPLVLQDSVLVSNTPNDTENTRMRIPILSHINDAVMGTYIDLTTYVDTNKDTWRAQQSIVPETIDQYTHIHTQFEHLMQSLPENPEVPNATWQNHPFMETFIEIQIWGGALLRFEPIPQYPIMQFIQNQVKLDLLKADKAFKKFRTRITGSYARNYAPFAVGILAVTGGVTWLYPDKASCPKPSVVVRNSEELIQIHEIIPKNPGGLNLWLKRFRDIEQCLGGANNSTEPVCVISQEVDEVLPRLQNAAAAVKEYLAGAEHIHDAESKFLDSIHNIRPVTSLQGAANVMQSIADATTLIHPLEQYSGQGYSNYPQIQTHFVDLTARYNDEIIKFIGIKTGQFRKEIDAIDVRTVSTRKMGIIVDSLVEHIAALKAFDVTEMQQLYQTLSEDMQQRKLPEEQAVLQAKQALRKEGDARRFKEPSELIALQKVTELVDSVIPDAEAVKAQAAQELIDDRDAQLATFDLRNRIDALKTANLSKEAVQAVHEYMEEQNEGFSIHARSCMSPYMTDLEKFVNRDAVNRPRYNGVKPTPNFLARSTLTKRDHYSASWYHGVYTLISNDQLIALAVEEEIKIADSELPLPVQADAKISIMAITQVLEDRGKAALIAACYITFGEIKATFNNRGVVEPTSYMQLERLVDKCSAQLQEDYDQGLQQPLEELVHITEQIAKGKYLRQEAGRLLQKAFDSLRDALPLMGISLGVVAAGVVSALVKMYAHPF